MKLEEKIDALIGREGGYSNNALDAGGETMWGITVAVARAFGYAGAMRDMPWSTAAQIYRSRYWLQPKFDLVDALSPALADRLFDIGVNAGQATGVRFMQRALNVLNQNQRAFADIAVDGGIGAMTIAALKAFLAARGADGHRVLLGMVTAQQSVYYIECAEKRVENETFEYGWQLNRAFGVSA
ncbi:putative peptidoglycan binding protein [Paraburkholderia sp. BL23I1N1]|uniref:glycoside hydrolase family 108 protein n=1 Tax=Paraburkholderia sp. BL23I1N1 TaxID=1938802 RepID=UPI000E713630|nr:glycosyl hydrolase 108 family protein [Paraburkholderia sp. BL23I1N1]RKE24369.1 putative peptidoglycan binding protein [Paraburkholderia sp. BL23I1N1]